MSDKAVFLDRDGVINIDTGYVSHSDDFEFIEGVIEACQKIKDMGYQLIVITNQSGIARGYFSEDDFMTLTEWMDWSFADKGVELDGIYYCPHHPEKGIGQYKQVCECRKPAPGMINSAKEFLKLDLEQSYLVGDKLSDIQAGKAAGIGTNILVRTGKPITVEGEELADHVIESLQDVISLLK
ncbi:D-glycero-beta-D-manno-heptose-1,7-bisphosphate 7-phosphatase [Alteromonadales bacterium alter-6D02]|nr:D-glycero-beta-D-manno-heptose-1,7-bisphosphate 7-phosphatase [Alteromonadales bacterium alter-6D02]